MQHEWKQEQQEEKRGLSAAEKKEITRSCADTFDTMAAKSTSPTGNRSNPSSQQRKNAQEKDNPPHGPLQLSSPITPFKPFFERIKDFAGSAINRVNRDQMAVSGGLLYNARSPVFRGVL